MGTDDFSGEPAEASAPHDSGQVSDLRKALHDLRTPLTTVVGAAGLIERSNDINRARSLAGTISEAANRMDREIQRLFEELDGAD